MPLPDITALTQTDDGLLARFRDRLREMHLTPKQVEPIVAKTAGVHPLLRRPLLAYHAREERGRFARVARAMMFGDPVPRAELDEALGDVVPELIRAGLLIEGEAGVVSPFVLIAMGESYLVTDDLAQGGDAVMGLGPATSSLCHAANSGRPIGTGLDVGCGAGTVALVLARHAKHVVATDVNARALALTRFNARLNGATNVEVREGSLLAPVAGERFDVVAAQPPFVPGVPQGSGGVFMSGGRRGDELALELLRDLPSALTPSGRAVVIAEWGHGPGVALPSDKVRAALGAAEVDVIVFQFDPSSIDIHAAEYAAAFHPTLGPGFTAEVLRRRTHLAELGFEVMAPTLIAVADCAGRKPRFDVIPAGPQGRAAPNARRIERLMKARVTVSTIEGLLAARVRMVDGVILREEQAGPGAHVPSTIAAILPPAALSDPMKLEPVMLLLATDVHENRTVRAGIEAFRERTGSGEPTEQLAALVANALLTGLVEIAE